MSEAEANDECTILDYLNEDCWRAVLAYVPMRDIMRSERVSQRWQQAIQIYLRGVHVRIKAPSTYWQILREPRRVKWRAVRLQKGTRVCKMKLTTTSFLALESWTCKLGPSVTTAFCNSEDSLNILGNCPNLEALMLSKLEENSILRNYNENFKWLKKMCLNECRSLSDRCIGRLMTISFIEELEIYGNSKATGQFLNNPKTKHLKSLILDCCWDLQFPPLLAASDALSGLTRLELLGAGDTYNDIHLLLDKLPKLERVKMSGSEKNGDKFFNAVCRLRSLKCLGVDFQTTDAHLEAVARCCPEIQRLWLRSCDAVTERGLAAACALAGARFTSLTVARSCLTDDAVVACVRACPNLTSLSVQQCCGLTRTVLARAAAARRELHARHPLRLHVYGTLYRFPERCIQEKHDGLIILP